MSQVGFFASRDHNSPGQTLADLALEPIEVAHLFVADGCSKFHFNRDNLPVLAFDDEVDLALCIACAQMPNLSVSSARINSHTLCNQ